MVWKSMDEFQGAVAGWLDRMFEGNLPYDQPSATAFAGALTFSLATSNADSPVLYCAPKTAATRELLATHEVPFTAREWLVDFVVVDKESATKRIPLVACESEMHANHGVGYSFDIWDDGYPKDGYVWDFCKLLHFPAPHLLFAARLPVSRFEELEASLRRCAQEYRELWLTRRVSVVLLPSGTKRRSRVRLGRAVNGGELCFDGMAG